jgi:hypothetical protein
MAASDFLQPPFETLWSSLSKAATFTSPIRQLDEYQLTKAIDIS